MGSIQKKYPCLTLRTVEKLSYARRIGTNAEVIERYFDLLEQTLVGSDLLDSPSLIFNCDETGLPLEHTPSTFVAVRGRQHPRAVTFGNMKQITVLFLKFLAPCMDSVTVAGWIEKFKKLVHPRFFSACTFNQTTTATS